MKNYNMDFDFNYDFAKVIDMEATEVLSAEDVEDGLEPETFPVKVCLSSHVFKRKDDTAGRHFELDMIEDLIAEKAHKFFSITNGTEFGMVNEQGTFGLVGKLYFQQKEQQFVYVAYTAIRNVIVDRKTDKEIEKRVKITRGTIAI